MKSTPTRKEEREQLNIQFVGSLKSKTKEKITVPETQCLRGLAHGHLENRSRVTVWF